MALTALGSVLVLGLGGTTAYALASNHSTPVAAATATPSKTVAPAAPAAPARTAAPAAPAKTAVPAAPAAPAAPAPASSPAIVNNDPTIIVNVPPSVGSTDYVPVPEYNVPAYVTTNEDIAQAYYTDIENQDYQAAWALGGSNVNNGVGYDARVAGYATTSYISLSTWSYYPDSNAVEVTITATQTDGSVRTYQGSSTVINGVIVGADIVQTG